MSNYLLYEIGIEEMPSRFVESTLDQLKENLTKLLGEKRVSFGKINTFATPRRLVLVVDDIALKQTDFEEEVKGPSKKISLDADGNFSKAALGFMRGKGLSEADVYFKNIGDDEYLFATIKEVGVDTKAVLMEVLPEIVKSVVFPKSMR